VSEVKKTNTIQNKKENGFITDSEIMMITEP
ncbi:uncharacterized protein METZ01_LOCUS208350, partial [marine metagenome]